MASRREIVASGGRDPLGQVPSFTEDVDAFTQQETVDLWDAIEIACGCIQVVSPRSALLKRLRELQKRE